MPKDAMLTIKLDSELHRDFMAEAQAMDRPASQLLRDMMRDFVKQRRDARDYEVWFRAEVEAGLREANDPNTVLVDDEVIQAEADRVSAANPGICRAGDALFACLLRPG